MTSGPAGGDRPAEILGPARCTILGVTLDLAGHFRWAETLFPAGGDHLTITLHSPQ